MPRLAAVGDLRRIRGADVMYVVLAFHSNYDGWCDAAVFVLRHGGNHEEWPRSAVNSDELLARR